MRRTDAPRRNLKGATRFRSLPLSFLVGGLFVAASAAAFAHSSLNVTGADADLMQHWRGYALSRITPDYSWAERDAEQARAPSLMDRMVDGTSGLRVQLDGHPRLALTLEMQTRTLSGHTPLQVDSVTPAATPLLSAVGTPFTGDTASTGLSRQFGRDGRLDLAVVMVRQRFASPSMDGDDYSVMQSDASLFSQPLVAQGTGMEVGFRQPFLGNLDWVAGYRSRVNMDSFQNFRGIYGNPGDLDIPARMQLGLAWRPGQQNELRLAAERVKYSAIEPFVSTALPRRLLAVLGDATSPEFSWRDLDVYSVSFEQRLNAGNRLGVRYSTGEQPKPSSPLLSRLLMEDAANYSVGLSFIHDAPVMQWRLMANYAPAEFVLGIPSSARSSNQPDGARQLEFESVWAWYF